MVDEEDAEDDALKTRTPSWPIESRERPPNQIEGKIEEERPAIEATKPIDAVQKGSGSLQNGKQKASDTWGRRTNVTESKERMEKQNPGEETARSKDRDKPTKLRSKFSSEQRGRRRIREMIGRHELRNEELEKLEGDLRQRMEILECSMPAVLVWNIWRMAQGAPVSNLRRALERHFRETSVICPSTPSRHFDCRVREAEAERKQAEKRANEARVLWTEKQTALQTKQQQLEEAKRIQREREEKLAKLAEEAKKLKEKLEEAEGDGSCEKGECGDTQCKQRLLKKASSVSSIRSVDVECLEKLQELAEAELSMKKQIADLERREEAYMRTLQQADELWSKAEGDTALDSLKEKLDLKTSANQQLADRVCELEDELETLRARMKLCRNELQKFVSVERVEETIGRDDDFAKVSEKGTLKKTRTSERMIGRERDVATVADVESLARNQVTERETLARNEVTDNVVLARYEVTDEETSTKVDLVSAMTEAALVGEDRTVSARPDLSDSAVDPQLDLPETKEAEVQLDIQEDTNLREIKEYLAKLGSLEELDYDDDYGVCAPDFVCNDEVFTETGLQDEELGPESGSGSGSPEVIGGLDREKRARRMERRSGPARSAALTRKTDIDDVTGTGQIDAGDVLVPRSEALAWLNAVRVIKTTVTECPRCSVARNDVDQVEEGIRSYVGIGPELGDDETARSEFKLAIGEIAEERILTEEKNELEGETIEGSVAALDVELKETIKPEEPQTAIDMKAQEIQGEPVIDVEKPVNPAEIISLIETKDEDKEIDFMGETEKPEIVAAIEIGSDTKLDSEEPKVEEVIIPSELPPESFEMVEAESFKEEILDEVEQKLPATLSTEFPAEPPTTPVNDEIMQEDAVSISEKAARIIESEIQQSTEITEKEMIPEEKEIAEIIEENTEKPVEEQIESVPSAKVIHSEIRFEIEKLKENELLTKVKKEKEDSEVMESTEKEEISITETPRIVEDTLPNRELKKEIREADIEREKVEETELSYETQIEEVTKPVHELISYKTESETIEQVISETEVVKTEVKEETLKEVEQTKLFALEKEIRKEPEIKEIDISLKEEQEMLVEKKEGVVDVEEILPEETDLAKNEDIKALDIEASLEEREQTVEISTVEKAAERKEIPEKEEDKEVADAEMPAEEKKAPSQEDSEETPQAERSLPYKELKEEAPEVQIEAQIEIKAEKLSEELPEFHEEEKPATSVEIAKTEEPIPPVEQKIEAIPTEDTIIRETEEAPPITVVSKQQELVKEIDQRLPITTEPERKEETKEEVFEETKAIEEKEGPEEMITKLREMETEVAKEVKEEVPSIRREIDDRTQEPAILAAVEIKEKPAALIDPLLPATPYLAIADIEERERTTQPRKKLTCSCKPLTCPLRAPTATTPSVTSKTQVIKAEIIQTVCHTVATETHVWPSQSITRPPKPKRIAEGIHVIPDTTRRARWKKRSRNRSTPMTASGTQTDKSDLLRTSKHDQQHKPIGRSLAREKEIRLIDYKKPSKLQKECSCCVCGKTTSQTLKVKLVKPPVIQPEPPVSRKPVKPPQVFTLTQETQCEKLCPDCKLRSQRSQERMRKPGVERIVRKATCDREACTCSPITSKLAVPSIHRTRLMEKKDQSCPAKPTKSKADAVCERNDLESREKRETNGQQLSPAEENDSLQDCVCYKVVETGEGKPIKKLVCSCGDSD